MAAAGNRGFKQSYRIKLLIRTWSQFCLMLARLTFYGFYTSLNGAEKNSPIGKPNRIVKSHFAASTIEGLPQT